MTQQRDGATPLERAIVIAVGSELLVPPRMDTNSTVVTEGLRELGIEVTARLVVGDDRAELSSALRHALERADLVVLTGGLGPTDDDLTRPVVAEVMGLTLEERPALVDTLRARFARRGLRMPDINRRQALVPRGATVIDNRNGTAPGLLIDQGGKVVVLLPGPPRELRPMLRELLDGPLGRRAARVRLVRRVVCISGRTESHVEEAIRDLYPTWREAATPISATILANFGQVELHLTARAARADEAAVALDDAVARIRERVGEDLSSERGAPLEVVVGELLRARGLRIALAESCTGGLLASRLTDVPGSSDYVERGVVSYSNLAKQELLGVTDVDLRTHGAVSEPVARAMAIGIRVRAGVDLGVAITGIAGPGGATDAKPVGTVIVAVAGPGDAVWVRSFLLPGGRPQVRFQSTQIALDMVRRVLLRTS